MGIWDNLKTVVFDMDGVVFIGQQLRLGIVELLGRLTEEHIEYHILTNTSAYMSKELAARLAAMGLYLEEERITTSSEVVASFIRDRIGAKKAFTLGGGRGLAYALQACGIEPLGLEGLPMRDIQRLAGEQESTAFPLVLGWTRDYDYDQATKVLRLEKCISEVYAAGVDRCYPDETGIMPAVAWLSGSVAALLEKEPINPAKPNPYALDYVLRKLKQPASNAAVIGDSISDIQSGNDAGCKTILVLGGAASESELENLRGNSVPWKVIQELTDLL
jgi:HAD superfamily hydrolase (TIGR01450 family)